MPLSITEPLATWMNRNRLRGSFLTHWLPRWPHWRRTWNPFKAIYQRKKWWRLCLALVSAHRVRMKVWPGTKLNRGSSLFSFDVSSPLLFFSVPPAPLLLRPTFPPATFSFVLRDSVTVYPNQWSIMPLPQEIIMNHWFNEELTPYSETLLRHSSLAVKLAALP